jgi:hypothetical protein
MKGMLFDADRVPFGISYVAASFMFRFNNRTTKQGEGEEMRKTLVFIALGAIFKKVSIYRMNLFSVCQ